MLKFSKYSADQSLMRMSILLFAFILTSASVAWSANESRELDESGDGQPIVDRALSRRLQTVKIYTTKPGENLEEVANLLYGHKSWWLKLRERNKSLIGYGANDRLPAGTKLAYLAPKIGVEYVVQKNDWLIRIVQWKYGDSSLWEEIYRKNAAQIANPNLIYPGEKLSLATDGTIRKSSGEIIVRGLNSPTPATPEVAREIASKPRLPEEPTFLGMKKQYLLAGFLSGIALLLFMPIFWWVTRPRDHTVAEAEPHLYLEKETPPEKPEPAFSEENGRKGFPHTFKRQSGVELTFDKSLIQKEDGEVNRKPNYFTISGKRGNFMKKTKKS